MVAAFYNHVARPILLRSIVYRIFTKRDALRRMAIDSGTFARSSEYHYLQDFLCKSAALVPALSVCTFLRWFMMASPAPNLEREEFEKNAAEELKKIRRETVEDVIAIMIVNSPIFTGVCLAIVPFLWIFGKVRSLKIFQATEGFVANFQAAPA